MQVLEEIHQRIHESTHEPDDTVFLTVMQDEGLILSMGLILVYDALPCLREAIVELSTKMGEVAHTQRPEWYQAPEWGTHE